MSSLVLSLLFIQFTIVVTSKNNVCKNYIDYWSYRDRNKNCMFNPDIHLDVPQLLEKYFGKYDVHEIPTEDGYFVTTFRVPRNNSRGAILLRHSAATDSYSWIGFGEDSIAYFYWKNGFELWLSNTRGTHYSEKHVKYSIDDIEFWNFSFHEIAVYDLRAALQYIYQFNGNTSPATIAFSMGCTEVLVYSSLFPEEALKLSKVNILIGPPSSSKYSKRKYLALLGKLAEELILRAKIGSVFGREQRLTRVIHFICPKMPFFCIQAFNIVGAGLSRKGQDPKLVPIVFQVLGTTSLKSFSHLGQLYFPGKFRWYNYKQKNIGVYGTSDPPEYPVWQILSPLYLVYFQNDGLVPAKDIDMLYQKLSENAKKYGRLYMTGMNHLDGFIGKHRYEIHVKVLNLLYDIFSE